MFRRIRTELQGLRRPERAVLLGVAIVHILGIGWGLPASDGWDVDGVAPRDFLPGLVETFTPGHYFTYPPLHLALLTILTLPVTLIQAARAPSLAPADLVAAFVGVPVMTTFAFAARLVSFTMSLVVVWALGKIAEHVFADRRARVWTMAAAGVEVAGTYYAHTTNLDLPALFWGTLSLLALVRAIENDTAKGLRSAAVLAACAIATKDQAYALFALTLPLAVGGWIVLREPSRRRELVREALLSAVLAVALVLFIDGAFFNPSGFAARLRFLTGPASKGFEHYEPTLGGRAHAFANAVLFFPNHYPLALAPFLAAGVVVALRGKVGRARLVALVPLLAMLSFTLSFNCVALRVEERFMMPQMQLFSVYLGGIALLSVERRWLPWAAAAALVLGLRLALTIDANLLGDARYDTERFVRDRVAAGETIEVYGGNTYLPRFPEGLSVERVAPGPIKSRSPIPGIVERQDALSAVAARSPKWIVVGQGFAWRYLQGDWGKDAAGHVVPPVQRSGLSDADTTGYIQSLFAERAGYRLVHTAHAAGNILFPPRPLHASIATDFYVFERN